MMMMMMAELNWTTVEEKHENVLLARLSLGKQTEEHLHGQQQQQQQQQLVVQQ